MAKNMFVNTTGLPIEKEMPSLIGMDFSNVGKEPLKLNIGKTISDFATKAQAVKEQVNATKLYNQLLDEKNKWMIENLSDPNAFSNKERRTEIARSYNSLIERQKAMLLGAKGTVSGNQYSELEQQFKQQTYNSLFDLQTKMNSAFVQETVETMGIEKNALVIKCANTSNYDDIIQYQQELSKCFDAEATLGIDNREQKIKTMYAIEGNYLQKVIQDNIINNTTDSTLAMLDENGQPKVDSQGNYIMDSNKILKRVNDTKGALLSKESIGPAAKKLAKAYGVSEEMAYDYIYNARDEYFKLKQSTIGQDLVYKDTLAKAKLTEIEEKNNIKRAKLYEQGEKLISDGKSPQEVMSIPGITYIDNNMFKNPDLMKTYTNGEYSSPKEMRDNGYYFLPISSNKAERIKNTLKIANDEQGIISLTSELSSNITNDTTLNSNLYDYLGATTDFRTNLWRNLSGNGTISQEDTQKYFLSMVGARKNKYNFGNLDITVQDGHSAFTGNSIVDGDLLQYITDNVDYFFEGKHGDFLTSDIQNKINQINSLYNSQYGKRSSPFVNKIENHKRNIKMLEAINYNTRAYTPDFGNGSSLNNYYGKQIDASFKKENASKLAKIGEYTVGTANRIDRPNNTKEYNANLKVQLNGYKAGQITLNQLKDLGYFKDDYDVNFFAPIIIEEINNNKYDKKQLYDLPIKVLTNEKIDKVIKNKYGK